MKRIWLISLLFLLALLAFYYWPVPGPGFDQVYAQTRAESVSSLQSFRRTSPPDILEVEGEDWEYLADGSGSETVLFLHGMTGAYDIWWQQIIALKSEYRVISVTYPEVGTLAKMEAGVLAVLEHEGVAEFHIVGTSLGGYFAQFLVSRLPDRVLSAVYANTFPPNDLILEKNGTIGALIPYLPEWLVMNVLQGSFTNSIYPASGNDELTLAFLNELVSGRVSKAQVAGRYQCVVEKFDPPVDRSIPILIIEASNDPLVEEELRLQLKATYPHAEIVTVDNGHFPYLSTPDFYTQTLTDFWTNR